MANISDIETEARALCDADTTSYPAATMLRRINKAYEEVVGWLINADGKWQFDDTNYTDFPIGTYTLKAGQGVYSFNDKFLQILDVQIKNSDGNFQIVRPIDQKDSDTLAPLREEFEDDGLPGYYDKLTDDTIELFPAPAAADVTFTNGLRIYFKRTASLFTAAQVTTGTKEPGFHSTFHYILSYMAAIPYCMAYKKDRVAFYQTEVLRMKDEMLKQYTKRAKDERKIITFKQINYI